MAVKGIGLNLGERLTLAGKKYEILNDIVDVQASIGKVRFLSIGDPVIGTEQVEENGRIIERTTGEIVGHSVNFMFESDDSEADSVTILEMSRVDIEELGLKPGDYFELVDPVITISRMPRGNSNMKLFAGSLKKAGQPQPDQPKKQEQHNEQK
ncbi:TPA: hypothetical protein U2D46_001227 [Streptococcus suis]|uniref:hypothetical protein n=1 Tax=Streptococcus suis TaxID=1307 RepID=UPI001553015C|nr:hypothetical protein [Streptococcus suis]MCK3891213.1 hypothetical protein [Streptococcus suis]MDW8713216.1 hypothetical protein [Streptococcus suis]NQJ87470.1 hypothetical protein [Streptococcus suis]NQL53271.1 hypothetical protein [Streptococcus suis]NQL60367.1 hypothetical protein [Streptococcus suis]